MGQKVHPTGIRLGVVKDHNSVWYADSKTYAEQLSLILRSASTCSSASMLPQLVVIERPARLRVSPFNSSPRYRYRQG